MILHITTSLENGGAEALMLTLIKGSKTDSHAIISLYQDGHYGPIFRDLGIQVYSLNLPRGKLKVKAVVKLYRLIKDINPNIIQCWMYHANFLGGIVARVAGYNNIVWGLHNTAMDGAGISRTTSLINKLSAWISPFVPKQVVHSSKSGAQEHITLGYSKNKMSVIPGGYNLDRFEPNTQVRNEIRAQLGISDEQFLIGMIARWHPQKDHKNLIEALALLPSNALAEISVILFGNGIDNDNNELSQLVTKNGLTDKVRLHGPVSQVEQYMNAIDTHVLSSAYGESFPNVINESMACGTPCITTDVADSGFIVGNVGLTVPPTNPKLLSEAILTFINEKTHNPDEWKKRQTESRNRIVENFSVSALVEKYERVWNQHRTNH